MKKIILPLAVLSVVAFSSCGGSEADKQAEAFCACVEAHEKGEDTKDCEKDMEALEDKFKEDEEAYKAFAKAAKDACPDAEKFIDRKN